MTRAHGQSAWASLLLFLGPDRAVAREHSWLDYSPPPECPGFEHVERRMAEWLNGTLPPPERLHVEAKLSWTGKNWLATVRVELDGHRTERSVEVETCIDGADFVALTTALAVEPNNDLAPEPPTPAPPLKEAEEPAPEPAEPTVIEPPPPIESARNSAVGFVGLGAILRSGSLPNVRGGIALQGGLTWSRWQARIELRALPPAGSAPPGAAAPIDFSLYSAALTGCYAWQLEALSVGPCVAFEGGVLISDQAGDGSNRSAVETPWLGVTPGIEAAFELSQSLRIYLGGGVSVPLTRFSLELDDGSLAHQAAVGGEGTLGVRFSF